MKHKDLYIEEGFGDEILALPSKVKTWFNEKYPTWIEDLSWHNDSIASFHVGNTEDGQGEIRPVVVRMSGNFYFDDGFIGAIVGIEWLKFDSSGCVCYADMVEDDVVYHDWMSEDRPGTSIDWDKFMSEVDEYVANSVEVK